MIFFKTEITHCHITKGNISMTQPVILSRWPVIVLTILRYSRSLLRSKIDFKVQNRVYELLTMLVKLYPGLDS